MSLRAKIIFLAAAFLGYFLLLVFLDKSRPPRPVMAKISVQEKTNHEEPGPSLMFPLREQFANEEILKMALSKLPENFSSEGNDPAAALAKRLKIAPDREAGMIQIIVSHPERARAAMEANAVAESARSYYLLLRSQYADKEIKDLKHQLKEKQQSLERLEEQLQTLRSKSTAPAADHALENELAGKERHLAGLLEIYKEEHPEVLQTKKEINYLMEQIARRPVAPVDETQLTKGQYDTVKTRYQELHDKLNKVLLEKKMAPDPIQIVALATPQLSLMRPSKIPWVLLFFLGGILLAAIGLFIYTKKWKARQI